MNYILFDDKYTKTNLLPLTYSRPVCDLRFGITTIRQKWERALGAKTSTLTDKYLSWKFPFVEEEDNILIKSNLLPDEQLIEAIHTMNIGDTLIKGDKILAYRVSKEQLQSDADNMEEKLIEYEGSPDCLNNTWELFSRLDEHLRADFQALTKGRKSQAIPSSNRVKGAENIFIEEGAKVEFAFLNAEAGPIYIGKEAVVMEGSAVRGPFAMLEGSQLKMGAKIYGATTLGPFCKVGGELNNVLFLGYSNKAHDGFVGNSVIGEWCNLGAGTNCSNLKNTYDTVRLWNYYDETFVDTGLQFCGLIMGDHSKTAIGTTLNTGTVVGVSVNLFGAGFPRNYISNFSWGGASGFKVYNVNKAMQVAEKVMARRNVPFDEVEKNILLHIYDKTVR